MDSTRAIALLSIFPDTVRAVLDSSILRRAQLKGAVKLDTQDLRHFAFDKHKAVDDSPFGGGQGMLFKGPVLEAALQEQLQKVGGQRERLKVIYTSPRGARLEQPIFEKLAQWLQQTEGGRVAVVCGRYEGVDERFVEKWVDLEVSLGDFILTGGEIPALALVDGLVRLLPGVLGHEASAVEDSFSTGLLEYPHYTKPREFGGMEVPEALLSGHHKQIDEWRLRQSLLMTFAFRPDLIRAHSGQGLPAWAGELLLKLKERLDLRS